MSDVGKTMKVAMWYSNRDIRIEEQPLRRPERRRQEARGDGIGEGRQVSGAVVGDGAQEGDDGRGGAGAIGLHARNLPRLVGAAPW